tara:strand:- start:77 stop:334 length:258 start_codon:yes stop_codon:yes gene_type:complete
MAKACMGLPWAWLRAAVLNMRRRAEQRVERRDAHTLQLRREVERRPELRAVVLDERVLLALPHVAVEEPLRHRRADDRAEAEGRV